MATMAQAAVTNCEICTKAPGIEYCLNCKQYFCISCKSLHKRQTVSKNHEFKSRSNVIKEVKCKEHNDNIIFLCTSCDVSVCKRCVSGKHAGHTMADIDDSISKLREKAKNEICSKRDLVTTNLQKMEQGLNQFDSEITYVINAIKEDGNRIKAMVDKEVGKLILAVNEKAKRQTEQLSNVISSTKGLVGETNALEQRTTILQEDREVAALIPKLKNLNDEMSRLQIAPLPVFPSMQFSSKSITNNDVINLLGTFNLSETQTTKVQTPRPIRSEDVQKEKKRTGYLFRCTSCGNEEINNYDPDCSKCGERYGMKYIKEV